MRSVKRRWRTLSIWLIISLVLQFGAYAFINKKVQAVLDPVKAAPPIIESLTADVPGTDLKDIQLSYAKDYVAYKDGGTLKVYNFKQKKVVFSKAAPAGSGMNMGVLDYEWLPDRNTLIYFYARKNPHPVTYTTVEPPAKTSPSTAATPETLKQELPKTEDPNQSAKTTSPQIKSTLSTNPTNPTSPTNKNNVTNATDKAKTTTPRTQAPVTSGQGGEGKVSTPKPVVVAHYGNPQLTDLYTLTLPESNDTTTEPDDRFNQTLSQFPAGGEIMQMAFSTFTNLMYLTIKTGSTTELLRIDVMKEVRTLSRAGETIMKMTVSDRFGTLYIQTIIGGRQEIVALDSVNGWQRTMISQNPAYTLLGERNGILYVGEVNNEDLVKVLSVTETATVKAYPSFQTVWTGTIPFKNTQVQIGSTNKIILYNSSKAYIISGGQLKAVNLQGSNNYVSVDGAELVQMTQQGSMTHFVLTPLDAPSTP